MEGTRPSSRGDESFGRRYRLGENRNYRFVYRRGKSHSSRSLVLIYARARDLKIGFSVSGKVGNAVTRNRVRRYLREDVRRLRRFMKCGRYVFVARSCAARTAHGQLTREVNRLLAQAGLIRDEVHPTPSGEGPRGQ